MLLGIRTKIEVELRDRELYDAPHRFPKVGHEPHQDERVGVVDTVGRQERVLGLFGELMVDGEVSEVEEGVAHTGVFPVDKPEVVAVGDEVRIQQIVVAGK